MNREDRIPEGSQFSEQLKQAKVAAEQMGLPKNPAARRRRLENFKDSYSGLTPTERMAKLSQAMAESGSPIRSQGSAMLDVGGGIGPGGQGLRSVFPKYYDPINSPVNNGIPYFDDSSDESMDEARHLARMWCRFFYMTHYLVPTAIDIFARFPLVGMEHTAEDPAVAEFYDDLFLGDLNYEEYLVQLGTEYWKVGEAFPMGDWSEHMGVWVDDQLMDPDEILVQQNRFLKTKRYYFDTRDENHELNRLVQDRDPIQDFEALEAMNPELVEAISKGELLEITPGLMHHLKHGGDPWSPRGYPILMRAFRHLLLEERLNRAQIAVAERLYNPLILLLLGAPNMGEDGEPWIPTQSDIGYTQQLFENLMQSEYRSLVHHFGLDIKVPLRGERVPGLEQDFARIEEAILGVFGINKSLLHGGSGATSYASTAISAEFLFQRLKTYQNMIRKFCREGRYRQVAEAQGFYEKEKKGRMLKDKMEEVLIVHPDGSKEVVKRKKLMIPDIRFRTMDFRDEKAQRDFVQSLKSSGVLISSSRLTSGLDNYDREVEKEKVVDDEVEKALTQAEIKRRVLERAREEELMPYLETDFIDEATDFQSDVLPPGKTTNPENPNKQRQRPEISDQERADMPKSEELTTASQEEGKVVEIARHRYRSTQDETTHRGRFGSTIRMPDNPPEEFQEDTDENSSDESETEGGPDAA